MSGCVASPVRKPAALVLLCILFASIRSAVSGDDCYFPDGTRSDDYYPCDYASTYSACCPAGFACASNHFCLGNGTLGITRGLCSDPGWEDEACPPHCNEDYSFADLRTVDTYIESCDSGYDEKGYFYYGACCYIQVDGDCCSSSSTDSSRVFTLYDDLDTTAYWDPLYTQYRLLTTADPSTVYLTTTYSTPFTTSTSTFATVISTSSSRSYRTDLPTITRSTYSSSFHASSTGSASSQEDTSYGYSYGDKGGLNGAHIGGIVAGSILLVGGVIGILLYRWRKNKSKTRPDPALRHNNPHHYGVRQNSDLPDNEGVMAEADGQGAKPVELGGKTYAEAAEGQSLDGSSAEKSHGPEMGEEHERAGLVADERDMRASYELPAEEERGRRRQSS